MDKCGICLKPAVQLFETGKEGVYACFKCQPLVPEVTFDDNPEEQSEEVQSPAEKNDEELSDISLYCGICHKTFQKNAQLQNHLRNHRAERRFVCMYCNKAFSQSNNLRAHLRIHTNERPYKCSECGKAFTQVTNLNNHVRLHTGERPFVCPEPGCNKAYAQVTNLNQHRKRHLNGRPVETTYDCTICGEQFQQRNHMYNHRRYEHAEVGKVKVVRASRKHECKVCDAVLPSERLLRQHAARHARADPDTDTGTDTDAGTGTGTDNDNAPPPPHDDKETLSCVFRSCGARFNSAHEHTEHLLTAHQLRVLSARDARPSRRGRPPKHGDTEPALMAHQVKSEEEQDPLEIKPGFRPIKILKVQSMFQ